MKVQLDDCQTFHDGMDKIEEQAGTDEGADDEVVALGDSGEEEEVQFMCLKMC